MKRGNVICQIYAKRKKKNQTPKKEHENTDESKLRDRINISRRSRSNMKLPRL